MLFTSQIAESLAKMIFWEHQNKSASESNDDTDLYMR